MRVLRTSALALAVVFAILPGIASAHANLTSCSIKSGQVFTLKHAPRTVSAQFAEELTPGGKSWMSVFEGEADHGLVNEKTVSLVDFKHPKHMTLKLPTLHRGPYYLIWFTVSALDGHEAAGIVYFKVT
jgi:methionine-rich copper-binding protein CopC